MNKALAVTLAMIAAFAPHYGGFAAGNAPVVTQIANRTGSPALASLPLVRRSAFIPRNTAQDAGLTTIAGNLTQYANSPYWGWFGYAVLGPHAGGAYNTEQWLATAFTPKSNSIATKIEVAAIYLSGTNGAQLSVNDDASGLPGKPIHTWQLTNLPTTACCAVAGGSYTHGVALSAGKQYWVVVATSAGEPTQAAIWGLTEYAGVQEHGSSFALYCSGGGCGQLGYQDNRWNLLSNTLYGLAFSVLGK